MLPVLPEAAPVLLALVLPTVPEDPTALRNLPASISVHVPGNPDGTDVFLVIYTDPTGYIAANVVLSL